MVLMSFYGNGHIPVQPLLQRMFAMGFQVGANVAFPALLRNVTFAARKS
jgi:hypothetical protein